MVHGVVAKLNVFVTILSLFENLLTLAFAVLLHEHVQTVFVT